MHSVDATDNYTCVAFLPEVGSVPKPIHGYPQSPEHIGDHIRRRRVDLGVFLKDTAGRMRNSLWTVVNWELGETTSLVRPRGGLSTEPRVTPE